jgi:hypothetical protein
MRLDAIGLYEPTRKIRRIQGTNVESIVDEIVHLPVPV